MHTGACLRAGERGRKGVRVQSGRPGARMRWCRANDTVFIHKTVHARNTHARARVGARARRTHVSCSLRRRHQASRRRPAPPRTQRAPAPPRGSAERRRCTRRAARSSRRSPASALARSRARVSSDAARARRRGHARASVRARQLCARGWQACTHLSGAALDDGADSRGVCVAVRGQIGGGQRLWRCARERAPTCTRVRARGKAPASASAECARACMRE